MKIQVRLETGKMSEREAREKIDRAAARATRIEQQRGNGDVSHDKMRRIIEGHAEKDRKDGKI